MSEEILKTLIRKRASIKSKLTSFKNFLNPLIATATQSRPDASLLTVELDQIDYLQLETRLIAFEDLLSKYDALHSEIIEVETEANLEKQFGEYNDFEDDYFKTLSKAKALLHNQSRVRETRPASSRGSESNRSAPILSRQNSIHNNHAQNTEFMTNLLPPPIQNTESRSSLVKLPTLQMKAYEGDPETFLSFSESFKSLVHNNDAFDDVTRFLHLKSVLGKEPSKVIESLDIIPANYTIALSLLEKRYKNTKFLIHSHIKGIVEYPKILKESAASVRQLADSVQAHLRALESLGEPISSCASFIIYLVADKLDYNNKKEWEIHIANIDSTPLTSVLIEFLEKRARLLEKIEKPQGHNQFAYNARSSRHPKQHSNNSSYSHVSSKVSHYQDQQNCPVCKESHKIFACKRFLGMSTSARLAEVKKLNLCVNCSRSGHFISNCRSSNCRKCDRKHSTLLHHEESNLAGSSNTSAQNSDSKTGTPTASFTSTISEKHLSQILPTAVVLVQDRFGRKHKCVALLDSGSMRSYMSISLCSKLGLPTTRVNIAISGINQAKSKVQAITHAKFESLYSTFNATLPFLLLQNISGEFPCSLSNSNNICIPNGINLANPNYLSKVKIDLLLGIDIFWRILSPDQPLASKFPYLWNTQLGYIVSGQFPSAIQQDVTTCHLTTLDLSRQISKFWEIESIQSPKPLSPEEQQCESSFATTHYRDEKGRFVVTIPLNSCPSVLGESKQNALRQFTSLEKRLRSNPKLKSMYVDFMSEYEALGHMTKVSNPDDAKYQYFIPHHGVYEEHSITTKLRVVFNSSCPTSSGISFNDIQLNGPVLQDDLFSILLRFRRFKYVITSDCAKMYRSILVTEEQRPLQRIFWRSDPSLPLEIYELCTVTYGEKAPSFLAIRCLFELASEHEHEHPEIAKIIRQDMYCDDLLTSCETANQAKYICHNITHILQSGGFTLRKWNSNYPEILDNAITTDIDNNILEFGPTKNTKTLGLLYNSYSDKLFFEITPFHDVHKTVTKRTVLSYISTIFDPLGLLNPCTITARIFMQKLWLNNSHWDEVLPAQLDYQWKQFCQNLPELNKLRIARQSFCESAKRVELHAFSDGSETAYGTCVYIRSIDKNEQITVQLLCSKTRVAPLKSLTIPKLELSGAVMMAQLVNKVKQALDINVDAIKYWVDSTIALSWINTQPHLLETFVSNRVAQIQTLSDISNWNHVSTDENPADLVTRDLPPQKLLDLAIWWQGPNFLSQHSFICEAQSLLVTLPTFSDTMDETNLNSCVSISSFEPVIDFNRYSSLNRLKRILAYCLRFIKNCKLPKGDRLQGSLTFDECKTSLLHLARLSQLESFPNEFSLLMNSTALPKKSPLTKLNPFYDSLYNVLRVGGRLNNSKFPHDKRHPVLISSKHTFSKLLFHEEHVRLLHAGPSQLLSSIRDRFWPINGRNLSKKTVFHCITCFRSRPRDINNLLGNLPADRLTPQFPFSVVGTDYCGPFTMKDKSTRGWKPIKCYVCLFICFSTKAVHLELVTDLSSEAFILCLRRFASRRGMPSKIYSDNGRTYCGAKSLLDTLGKFLLKNHDELITKSQKENFNWIFLPPYSPSLGGLWEAGIKSTKFHLKRVIGNCILSYEHFSTVLTQVEAILNSRPLSPLSCHQDDLLPLTPSHFLVGRPITTVPDPDVTHIPENQLSLFQQIQQIIQNFWTRWSKEYVSELQVRTRWQTRQPNVEENTLVLIKDDHLPPNKWKLGRVIKTVSGSDRIVRIVRLRTQCGETTRSISKICPLPLNCEDHL